MEILDKKSILEMDRGAVIELADYGMAKLLDDIMNPNTQATSPRTLTITVKLTPNEQRTKVDVEYTHKLGFGKMLPLGYYPARHGGRGDRGDDPGGGDAPDSRTDGI